MPAFLARIGLIVFATLFAIPLVVEQPAAGRALVGTAGPADAPAAVLAGPPASPPDAFVVDGPPAVSGFQPLPAAETEAAAEIGAVVIMIVPGPVDPSADGIILASWYGPGFYGNRTACGQIYTPEIIGVAHKTLPCGTLLTLTYGSRVLTVPVIDRGPYVAGRTLDLSSATRIAIGCADLCTLRMQVLR